MATRLCQFCKHVVDLEKPKGPLVPYGGKWLHLECWKKLVKIAARTGGTL